MIIHCTRKLTARLPTVSSTPLQEDSPLGSWNAHIYTIDRRQCVMFCHDLTRYILFLPGLRKQHFAVSGNKWFRALYFDTLQVLGCPALYIKQVELSLGPIRFDSATDRSVQGSMRVARQDLDAWLMQISNVMDIDPLDLSCRLNHRPVTAYGKTIWPDSAMLELIADWADSHLC